MKVKVDIPICEDTDNDLPYADLSPYETCKKCHSKKAVITRLSACDINYENPDIVGFRIRLIVICPDCGEHTTHRLGFKAMSREASYHHLEATKMGAVSFGIKQ